MKRSHSAIAVLMVMILMLWPSLQSAAASDRSDRPVRLTTTARFSPIGTIAGRALVDGRALDGDAPVWGGELIQTATGESLRVSLDGVGQITLADSAIVRISTATGNPETNGQHI